MTTSQNPAGRLHDILDRILKANGGETPMKLIWTQILGVETHGNGEPDAAQLLHRLSQVIQLNDECKALIDQHPEVSQSLYLEPFQKFSEAFSSFNLNQSWASFTNRLSQDTLNSMRYAADYFSRDHSEEVIDVTTLRELLAEMAGILEKVIEADISEDLKAYLTNALEDMRLAILGYRIQGSAGLKAAFENGLGGAVRYPEEISAIEEDRESEVLTSFFSLFTKVDLLVATSLKIKRLAAPITRLILPESPDSE